MEGVLTVVVLAYLGRIRPELICLTGTTVLSRRTTLATLLAGAVVCAGGALNPGLPPARWPGMDLCRAPGPTGIPTDGLQ